jgi:DtxR family Mn-dependent transcriptional regulator
LTVAGRIVWNLRLFKPRFRRDENIMTDLTKSERELLKAVYRQTGEGDEAHTGNLADALGVSPGTITAAVKRLADRKLLDHRPYRGVELTPEGRRVAVATIRRHRIVERFLADMCGYPWNEADVHAKAFEHELPQEVEDRLFVALGRPAACPHGFPIPDAEAADIPASPAIYDLEPGSRALVAVPGATDPEIVAFLDGLGLRPGVEVEIADKHPFDGPLVLRVDGDERTLGSTVARQVFVQQRIA